MSIGPGAPSATRAARHRSDPGHSRRRGCREAPARVRFSRALARGAPVGQSLFAEGHRREAQLDTLARRIRAKLPGHDTGIEVRKSVCTMCDPMTQCGLDVYVRDGRAVKVEGTRENPHSRGTLCAKGAATRQYVYHRDRLLTPLRRTGPRGSGEFEPVSWDEALGEVASHLERLRAETGPESVVFYVGYPKHPRPFVQRLALQYGSPNFCTESSACHRASAMAFQLLYGQMGGPDLRSARCLLAWGTNPFYASTPMLEPLLDALDRGMRLIVVDPRLTPLASRAELHLRPRPGTDGALALGFAHVILDDGLEDAAFLEAWAHGLPEYREYVAGFDPATVEGITGVPAAQLRAAARLYAATRPAALMSSGASVVHHTNGVQNARAVYALIGLTGNWDVAGGNRPQPYSWLEVAGGGFATRQREFERPRPLDDLPPRVGAARFPVWAELTDQGQSMDLPRHIRSGDPYPLRGMVAFGLNHRMFPDSAGFLEALQRLDFICDVDLFATDSSKYADIVLPACSSLERGEVRVYPEKYVVATRPVVEPLGQARSDTDIVLALARRLALDDALLDPPAPAGRAAATCAESFDAAMDWILAPAGLTMAELAAHPGGMPVPAPSGPQERGYESGGFPTPTGKMELASSVLSRHAAVTGVDPLPVYVPPRHEDAGLAGDYPFVLSTGSRLPMFIHSRTYRLRWTRGLRPDPTVDLNPADARRLGVGQDEWVDLTSPAGTVRVRAALTELAMPGVVYLYHDCPEADANLLLRADDLDPVSGFPAYKGARCRVTKPGGGGGLR